MTNLIFHIEDGIGYGTLPNGMTVLFDADKLPVVSSRKWYYCKAQGKEYGYLTDKDGIALHSLLVSCPEGCEVDHISMDTLDNRSSNLRICTHQQNQCNQGLQSNNTSGVSGVSYYPPRKKYRARIKIGQHDIHLGYYLTFEEAVMARNIGMRCMFGEYARYDDVPDPPEWICEKVILQCRRFAGLSLSKAFSVSGEIEAA